MPRNHNRDSRQFERNFRDENRKNYGGRRETAPATDTHIDSPRGLTVRPRWRYQVGRDIGRELLSREAQRGLSYDGYVNVEPNSLRRDLAYVTSGLLYPKGVATKPTADEIVKNVKGLTQTDDRYQALRMPRSAELSVRLVRAQASKKPHAGPAVAMVRAFFEPADELRAESTLTRVASGLPTAAKGSASWVDLATLRAKSSLLDDRRFIRASQEIFEDISGSVFLGKVDALEPGRHDGHSSYMSFDEEPDNDDWEKELLGDNQGFSSDQLSNDYGYGNIRSRGGGLLPDLEGRVDGAIDRMRGNRRDPDSWSLY